MIHCIFQVFFARSWFAQDGRQSSNKTDNIQKTLFFTMFLQILIARPGRRQNGQLAHKVRKTLYFTVFFDHPENPQEAIQANKVNFILFFTRFFCDAVPPAKRPVGTQSA